MRIFFFTDTDNNTVNNFVAVTVASILAVMLFPVQITNYIYINLEERFAGVSVRLYGFLGIKHINTIKNKPDKMLVDGKEKNSDPKTIMIAGRTLFNNICITKIIQLGDYGAKNAAICTLCLAQRTLTDAFYAYLKSGGNKGKLKNYSIINQEHDNFIYYAKISGTTNLIASLKILIILLSEKINEQNKE